MPVLMAQAQTMPSTSAGPSPGIVRSLLATTPLPSVVDTPRHFRLVSVNLPEGKSTNYKGPNGFVAVLEGTLDVAMGKDKFSLAKDEGLHVAAGVSTSLKAGASKPVKFLHFVLVTKAELGAPMESAPALVTEVAKTPVPIPGLKPGPYEFTLARITFPPRFPFNPPHHRSGAALYYIASGAGVIGFGGKTEARPTGASQYEPNDFIHHWANPGDKPLVIYQANISQEGVPVVIFVPQAAASAAK
jgi:mannose-6-phosphate isomerase-like protein (cupin superfamily)